MEARRARVSVAPQLGNKAAGIETGSGVGYRFHDRSERRDDGPSCLLGLAMVGPSSGCLSSGWIAKA